MSRPLERTGPVPGPNESEGEPGGARRVSVRTWDRLALAMGVLAAVLLVGWLTWASLRNQRRDRALIDGAGTAESGAFLERGPGEGLPRSRPGPPMDADGAD